MATTPLFTRSLKASTQFVQFDDGMVVTAEDLTAATRHPLELMQVLIRAYFGCGIVCGLELTRAVDVDRRDPCASEALEYALLIRPGVAIDCAGTPLELCGPACIDLKPDPCVAPLREGEKRTLHIAIRRASTRTPTPRDHCCCQQQDEGQCSRVRDAVEIGVFDQLPEGVCRATPPPDRAADRRQAQGRQDQAALPDLCACLTACPDCDRCVDWVYLGRVAINRTGIIDKTVDLDERAYVKPIACFCGPRKRLTEQDGRDAGDGRRKLEDRIAALEKKLAEGAAGSGKEGHGANGQPA